MRQPLFLLKLLIHSGAARWFPGVQRRLGGGADFLRYYSNRLLASPLGQLEEAAANLQPSGVEVIDLTRGAPSFDVLPSASTKLPADRRGWPPFAGRSDLCGAVAEKLLRENGLAFNPAGEILITAGVLGAMQTVLDAFVNRGDRVVLFDPCSPLFSLLAGARQARVRWLPTWMEEGRTRFRLDHLARALCGARLLVLNSPNNPTGGVIASEDLEEIAWWAARYDVLLFSDESFERYLPEGSSLSIGTLPRARAAHSDGRQCQPEPCAGLGAGRLVGRLSPLVAAVPAHRRPAFAVRAHAQPAGRSVGPARRSARVRSHPRRVRLTSPLRLRTLARHGLESDLAGGRLLSLGAGMGTRRQRTAFRRAFAAPAPGARFTWRFVRSKRQRLCPHQLRGR